jgi:hypothetical protein
MKDDQTNSDLWLHWLAPRPIYRDFVIGAVAMAVLLVAYGAYVFMEGIR